MEHRNLCWFNLRLISILPFYFYKNITAWSFRKATLVCENNFFYKHPSNCSQIMKRFVQLKIFICKIEKCTILQQTFNINFSFRILAKAMYVVTDHRIVQQNIKLLQCASKRACITNLQSTYIYNLLLYTILPISINCILLCLR